MLDGIQGLVVKTGNIICATEEKVLSLQQQETGLDVIQTSKALKLVHRKRRSSVSIKIPTILQLSLLVEHQGFNFIDPRDVNGYPGSRNLNLLLEPR